VADPVYRVHRKLKDFLGKVAMVEIVDSARQAAGPKGR